MSLSWIQSSAHSANPVNAVVAGYDIDGSPIYVGRAYHEGDLIPAKVIPNKHVAYVSHNGLEHAKGEYQVLCGTGIEWEHSSGGRVPQNAVVGGNQSNGESLFVGRANVGGSLSVGKIHPTHGVIYVPFDGTEHGVRDYEVLTAKLRSSWVPSSAHSPLPSGATLAGQDQDGSPMYVGRAWHEGDLVPAKVLPTKNACYIAYGGDEIFKEHFDVLCHGNVNWVKTHPSSRSVPPFAVSTGTTAAGEPLYVGRAHHEGSYTVGKYHLSHGSFYIPFAGNEVAIHSEFEVLVEY